MDSSLLWGTVEMLILEVLSRGPSYGYEITQSLKGLSNDYVQLKEGSLYPALHRMQRQKLLSAFWDHSPEGRRRKYYKLTAKGRRHLETKRTEWSRFAAGVNAVLGSRFELA